MKRSLWPKEHGAYVELSAPLITALSVWGSIPGLLLALMAIAGFLANEPLLVLIGARGRKLPDTFRTAARRRLIALLIAASMFAGGGLWLAPPESRLALIVPLGLLPVITWMVLQRREKTLIGELTIIVALSAMATPIALAGGAAPWIALTIAGAWIINFTIQTIAIHMVKGRPKSLELLFWGNHMILLAALIGALRHAPLSLMLVPLPPIAVSTYLAFIPIKRRQMKQVGWTFLGADLISMVLLLIGLT